MRSLTARLPIRYIKRKIGILCISNLIIDAEKLENSNTQQYGLVTKKHVKMLLQRDIIVAGKCERNSKCKLSG